MKRMFALGMVTLLTFAISAQAPQKMSYQRVVRNSSGALVANHPVAMKISILQGTPAGTVVYSETYNTSLTGKCGSGITRMV